MSTQTDDSAEPGDNTPTEAKKPTGKRVALGCAVVIALMLACTVAVGVFADPEETGGLEPLTAVEAACLDLSAELTKAQAEGMSPEVIFLALAESLGTSVAGVLATVQECTKVMKDYNDRNAL